MRSDLCTMMVVGSILPASLSANDAFSITCDRTTMSQDDILNGRLICDTGIAPVRPDEFVVCQIFQYIAEAQRQEQ